MKRSRIRRQLGLTAAALGVAATIAGAANAADLATPIPVGDDGTARPYAITTDDAANLWFTDPATQKVGSLTPGGEPVLHDAPNAGKGITFRPDSGADGDSAGVWFTTTDGSVARMSADGSIGLSGSIDAAADLRGIVASTVTDASDRVNPLWIAASGGSTARLWRASAFLPGGSKVAQGTEGTKAGRDIASSGANIYMTEAAGAASPGVQWVSATGGEGAPVLLPGTGGDAYGIAVATDGSIWVTYADSVKHFSITPAGEADQPPSAALIDEFELPAGAIPHGITIGPDGAAWFAESASGKVGRVTAGEALRETALPGCANPEDIAVSGDALYLTCTDSANLMKVLPGAGTDPDPGGGDPGTGDPGTGNPGTGNPGTQNPPGGGGAGGGQVTPPTTIAKGSFSLKKKTIGAGTRFAVNVKFTQPVAGSRVKVQYRSNNTKLRGAIRSYRVLASKLVTGKKAVFSLRISRPGTYRLRVSYVAGGKTTFAKAVVVKVVAKPKAGR